MTVAQALHMPLQCPCGGQYLLVRKGSGPGVSLMHKKPACPAYDRMTTNEFLRWVQTHDGKPPNIDSITVPETPLRRVASSTGPNRRQRRANASAKRRKARRTVSLDEIHSEYQAAIEGDE